MCTLAIYFRALPGFPIVVAANRDEFLSRPTRPPMLLDAESGIYGGRDDVAGGTWLGVSRGGLVAALLNRRSTDPPDPARRSRGHLCLDALRAGSASEARRRLEAIEAESYNPFNLLVADERLAWVATNQGGRTSLQDLPPGLHLLTNLDVNDPTCPRIAGSHRMFAELLAPAAPPPASPDFVARLRGILSRHDTPLDPRDPTLANSLCLHLDGYGTRSSTLLFRSDAGRWTYLHANGRPCETAYAPQDPDSAVDP